MKKQNILIIISTVLFSTLLTGCADDVGEVKSGEIKLIPLTSNLAIGTDSTIVIVERETGRTLNTINRH